MTRLARILVVVFTFALGWAAMLGCATTKQPPQTINDWMTLDQVKP